MIWVHSKYTYIHRVHVNLLLFSIDFTEFEANNTKINDKSAKGTLTCDICQAKTTGRDRLRKHFRGHFKYQCSVCYERCELICLKLTFFACK